MAASPIPVVTGIGHEVDVSIADLVADHHAHTPTEAAQVVTAHWRGASEQVEMSGVRLRRAMRSIVAEGGSRLAAAQRHAAFRRPLDRVNQLRQYLDDRQRAISVAMGRLLQEGHRRCADDGARLERYLPTALLAMREKLGSASQRLDQLFSRRLLRGGQHLERAAAQLRACHPRHRISRDGERLAMLVVRMERAVGELRRARLGRLEAISRQLDALSPEGVLRRGYTITSRKRDGTVVRSAGDVRPGDRLITRFADGTLESIAGDSLQLRLFE